MVRVQEETSENFYALYLWICTPNITPEQAFELLETGKLRNRRDITKRDLRVMTKLHERLTYKQIGEIYNMDWRAVHKRISRYKKRSAI